MKLHWVELENWRQHSKTRIDFDAETTVIYGPNGVGKSTILEALSRGFFDKSGTQSKAIKRITPLTASGNIQSTVRIEFTLKGTRYRVDKSFNLKNGTSLYKIVDGKNVLRDQETADEELVKLLEADLPSQGASKPSLWGAFQWLWANQDNRELPDNKEGDPTSSLHLATEDTGGMLVTPRFQAVRDRVYDSYAEYFTPTGKYTKNSRVSDSDIDPRIEELEQSCAELSGKIEKVDEKKQRLDALEQELPVLESKLAETKRELEKARSEAANLSSIKSELQAAEASAKEPGIEAKEAERALKEFGELSRKKDKLQSEGGKIRNDLSRLEAVCELLDRRLQEKIREVEGMADKIRQCEELTRDARNLRDKSDAMKKIEELEKKLNRISGINSAIEELRGKEAPIVPSNKEIEKLTQSRIQIEVLRESLISSGLTVSIETGAEGSLSVEIDGEKLKDGEFAATGTESVSVEAPGLGKVTVAAQLDQARDAKADISRLEESIRRTLDKYDLASIDDLRELKRGQDEIANSLKELVAEKKGIDERSIDELNLELQRLRETYAEYDKLERSPIVVELNPTDGSPAKLVSRREKEEDETRRILDKARAERDEINKEFTERKEELAGIRAEQRHISEELDSARIQERELIHKYGSVENQEGILSAAKAEQRSRNQKVEKIRQHYEEMEKGPANKVKRLEKQEENQYQMIRQQRTAIDQLDGAIGAESLEGGYSELAKTESDIEILRERLENEKIRADSYKLLKEELDRQYQEAFSAVVGPIRDDVEHYLSYITNSLHENVELNEYLFPTRLGERGLEDIALEFTDGSSGLKEALAICVRLAVAKHLSEKEPQCLILDDPFVHVSSDRSNRMIELINEAIEEYGLQVIILTHRQMEFAGFAGKMIDIQSVK